MSGGSLGQGRAINMALSLPMKRGTAAGAGNVSKKSKGRSVSEASTTDGDTGAVKVFNEWL